MDREKAIDVLSKNVTGFNNYRRENPEWIPDLRNARLEKIDLNRAELSKANLQGANLSGSNLVYANLTSANLENSNLQRAAFKRATLDRANLEEANLSGADLEEASLSEAKLKNGTLRGTTLAKANLEGANLKGANLIKADLSLTNLKNTSMQTANLTANQFNGTNLEGVNFEGANLNATHLLKRNLDGYNLRRAVLKNAKLSKSSLINANLEGADLEGADLSDTNLQGADLRHTNINSANFNYAVLTDADCRSAQANRETDFFGADVVGMRILRFTLLDLEDFGGLTRTQQRQLNQECDYSQLQSSFGGFLGLIHMISLICFLFPYAFFLVKNYIVSQLNPTATGDYLIIAFLKYIWSAGRTSTSWHFNVWFAVFLALCIFNVLRALLFWKTKKLELEETINGLLPGFTLDDRVSENYKCLLTYRHWFDWMNYLFRFNVVFSLLSLLLFLLVRLPK